MYQVSIKAESKLEFITPTRMEVPALAGEEGGSPADDRLPIHTQTAPQHFTSRCEQVLLSLGAQGGRNHRGYVLPNLSKCPKPCSVHRPVLYWSAKAHSKVGIKCSAPCWATLLPTPKIKRESKTTTQVQSL